MKPYIPLPNARHEAFCCHIAAGQKLGDAYLAAGFKSGNAKVLGYRLRHRPEIDARVKALLQARVDSGTRRFLRREKGKGDLLARVVKELEDIAFQDIREVVDWRQEAETNAQGEVIGVRESVAIRDSAKLSPAAAKAVKGVFMKGDRLRLEMHDKRAALEALAKILKGDDVQPAGNVTVNQVNVGAIGSVEAAQRIAFMLAAATAAVRPPAQPAAPLIEGVVSISQDK